MRRNGQADFLGTMGGIEDQESGGGGMRTCVTSTTCVQLWYGLSIMRARTCQSLDRHNPGGEGSHHWQWRWP
jgi:hypothetical protein